MHVPSGGYAGDIGVGLGARGYLYECVWCLYEIVDIFCWIYVCVGWVTGVII